ncbi:MAG TPA: stage II sporulation protein M [Clostridia bacterium]|nr:stage II sporulation protein M [Clostridia bacterium]
MAFIRMEYQTAFAFLKRLLRPILLMLAIFFIVAVATHFILSTQYREDPAKMAQQIAQLEELINDKDLIDESGRLSAFGLFCNNFMASGMAVVAGVVPFIFIPLAALGLNASLIGMISAIMAVSGTGGLYELAVSVAPHGVFEIPALLISAAMGVALCIDISKRILYKKRDLSFLTFISELVRLSVLVVVPLLVVAAMLEAYLTPALMAMLL